MLNKISGIKIAVLFLFMLFLINKTLCQEQKTYHFNGSVSLTNNGFSFVPSFSLGKPATIVDISMGGNRFSFDPQFRFDLDGLKPWSFIFIWRYKLIQTERFQLRTGVHLPAIAFVTRTFEINGVPKERIIPRRFITPELIPTYTVSKHLSLGMYYIYGIGLEKEDQTRHTHFISLRAFVNEVPVAGGLHVSWNPQVYYLYLDGSYGYYTAHSVSLAHNKLPISIGTTMNIELQSDVPTKDFDWNISLVYSFKNQLSKNKDK